MVCACDAENYLSTRIAEQILFLQADAQRASVTLRFAWMSFFWADGECDGVKSSTSGTILSRGAGVYGVYFLKN